MPSTAPAPSQTIRRITTAPDPDPGWLSGSSRIAMIKTDRAISKEGSEVLKRASSDEGPVMVLYGAFDIFGAGTDIVRSRFPHAVQVTLENSGHVHWLQNPAGYAKALGSVAGSDAGCWTHCCQVLLGGSRQVIADLCALTDH